MNEFNECHIIEGLDRCHIILCTLEEHLKGHPAILKAGCDSDIEQVIDIIAGVYQKIGNLSDD